MYKRHDHVFVYTVTASGASVRTPATVLAQISAQTYRVFVGNTTLIINVKNLKLRHDIAPMTFKQLINWCNRKKE